MKKQYILNGLMATLAFVLLVVLAKSFFPSIAPLLQFVTYSVAFFMVVSQVFPIMGSENKYRFLEIAMCVGLAILTVGYNYKFGQIPSKNSILLDLGCIVTMASAWFITALCRTSNCNYCYRLMVLAILAMVYCIIGYTPPFHNLLFRIENKGYDHYVEAYYNRTKSNDSFNEYVAESIKRERLSVADYRRLDTLEKNALYRNRGHKLNFNVLYVLVGDEYPFSATVVNKDAYEMPLPLEEYARYYNSTFAYYKDTLYVISDKPKLAVECIKKGTPVDSDKPIVVVE